MELYKKKTLLITLLDRKIFQIKINLYKLEKYSNCFMFSLSMHCSFLFVFSSWFVFFLFCYFLVLVGVIVLAVILMAVRFHRLEYSQPNKV